MTLHPAIRSPRESPLPLSRSGGCRVHNIHDAERDARLERFPEDPLQSSAPGGRLQVAFAAEDVGFREKMYWSFDGAYGLRRAAN